MANYCLNNHLVYFLQLHKTDLHECSRCDKSFSKDEYYRYCLECDKGFCLDCFPKGQRSCCMPVTLEEIDNSHLIHVSRVSWNRRFNRGYCSTNCNKRNSNAVHTHWNGRLPSSPERFPYFVPSNWYRLSLQVNYESIPDWSSHWHTLYHGTHPQNIHKIIENGFLVRQCQHGFPALYVSPSIIYSSHPRYARVVVHNEAFYQFVLEVRVDTRKLQPIKKRETLSVGTDGDIDPNFPTNEDLEFLFKLEEGKFLTANMGIVVTGVMVRKSNIDPACLPSSWWWCKWRSLSAVQKHYYNGLEDIGPFDNSISKY